MKLTLSVPYPIINTLRRYIKTNYHKLLIASFFALCACVTSITIVIAAENTTSAEKITPAFQYNIPNIPGKTVTSVVVDYKPGAKSLPHRHGKAFVVAYVLSGSIRSQLDDGKVKVYKTGESWSENPGAHHVVGENASKTKPAKLLAIFIADSNEKDLVVFDK